MMMFRSASLLQIALVAGQLAGCSGGAADLTITPTSIDFGDVVVGTSAAQSIEVTNTGSAETTLTFDLPEGTPFSVALSGAIKIQPADSRLTFLEALPLSTGTATTVLQLAWDQETVDVALTVNGVFAEVDADGDGVPAGLDCDDHDATSYPDAPELCDGVDNDCNGTIDDDADQDNDGSWACNDCDDANPTAFPGATEACDGVDNDCDGQTDEDFDVDGDGYRTCDDPPDCDDSDSNVNPAATELCNGLDEDCDGVIDNGFPDADEDGEPACTDCDDTDPLINHAATELCDGVDDNCDGQIDEGQPDLDGDGFACDDCDDTDGSVYPGAPEICGNGQDENCDGVPDDGCNIDLDGDGFGADDCDDTNPAVYPGAPALCDGVLDNDCDGATDSDELDSDADGASTCAGDCDDGDPALNIADADGDGASTCAGDCDDGDAALNIIDADGDGASTCAGDCDDGDPALNIIDADGDGQSSCAGDCADNDPTVQGIDGDGDGWTACTGDCDDGNSDVYPGAPELCDGVDDNNCDGATDANITDADADGETPCEGDCNDGEATVYTGAPELCDAFDDNNCDGATDANVADADGDGDTTCDGDCDDSDPALNLADADGDGDTTCDGDCDDADALLNLADADADGASSCDGDCDDNNASLNLADADADGASSCDGDCDDGDPALNLDDLDADGQDTCSGDCDDGDATIYAGAAVVCSDAVDRDCDGNIDPPCLSCADALAADPTRAGADGVYTIDTDGSGPFPPLEAWCDMTTDLGGWTLILRTTQDGVANHLQITDYASVYADSISDASSAGPLRVAAQHWEVLGLQGDMMVRNDIAKAVGGSCDPMRFGLFGGAIVVSDPASDPTGTITYTYPGASDHFIVAGASPVTLSTTDRGPSTHCVNDVGGVPWFWGNCSWNPPTISSIFYTNQEPAPTLRMSTVLGVGLNGYDLDTACAGDAPETQSAFNVWLVETQAEWYLR